MENSGLVWGGFSEANWMENEVDEKTKQNKKSLSYLKIPNNDMNQTD